MAASRKPPERVVSTRSQLYGNALVKRWGIGWHRVSRIPRTELPYEEEQGQRAMRRSYALADIKAYESTRPALLETQLPRDPERNAKIRAMRLTTPRPSYAKIAKTFGVAPSLVYQILRDSGGDPAIETRRKEEAQFRLDQGRRQVEAARARLLAQLLREKRTVRTRAARKARRAKAVWERNLAHLHEFALHCNGILEALRACAAREGAVPPNGPEFEGKVGYTVRAVRHAFGSLNGAFQAAGLPTRPSGARRSPEATLRAIGRAARREAREAATLSSHAGEA